MKDIYFSLSNLIDFVVETSTFVKVEYHVMLNDQAFAELNSILKKRCDLFGVSLSMLQFGDTMEVYLYPPGK